MEVAIRLLLTDVVVFVAGFIMALLGTEKNKYPAVNAIGNSTLVATSVIFGVLLVVIIWVR
jgi:hypothetical protein